MKIQSIWICGVGGVGGYFGGRIANKISQLNDCEYGIYFLARGLHLKAIKNNGLKLHTSDVGELLCKPTIASDNVNEFPTPDLCLICIKSYDLNDLISVIKGKVAENTIIIPLMNGIDIYERIRKNLKSSIVLPSCVYIGSYINSPGFVIQSGNPGFFYSGFDLLYPNYKPQTVLDFFNEMKIDMRWQDDPNPIIWQKYLLVTSFALVSAHTGQTLGGIINDKNSRVILEKIMKEIVRIAERKRIPLPSNIIEKTIEFCKDYPETKPSYARDIEKGGRSEGDLFGGAIIRMGRELGIPTPMTASIYKEI